MFCNFFSIFIYYFFLAVLLSSLLSKRRLLYLTLSEYHTYCPHTCLCQCFTENQSTCKMHEENFHFVSLIFLLLFSYILNNNKIAELSLYRNEIKMNRNRKRDLYKCEFFLHPIFFKKASS